MKDVRPLELRERRALLRKHRRKAAPALLYSEHLDGTDGEAMFRLGRPLRRQQHDLGPPGMLLRDVAVTDDRPQAAAIDGGEGDGDTRGIPSVSRLNPIGECRRRFDG